jgi:hypothetical protein
MRGRAVMVFGLSLFSTTTAAAAQVAQVQIAYDTYAAGIEVMQMNASFGLGPLSYSIDLNYHTTGLVGLFYGGRQVNSVRGVWHDEQASPLEFFGEGVWRGHERRTLIAYANGQPDVRELEPPQDSEREPVPRELQRRTMNTLSALAHLMRRVERDRTCETTVRTFDGRRILDITAHDGGPERLAATGHSAFSGPTIRCDFTGRELAGFLIGDNDPDHRRPLHGSAWLAALVPSAPPLPVQIAFQTRWFGLATMYLTGVTAKNAAAARPN